MHVVLKRMDVWGSLILSCRRPNVSLGVFAYWDVIPEWKVGKTNRSSVRHGMGAQISLLKFIFISQVICPAWPREEQIRWKVQHAMDHIHDGRNRDGNDGKRAAEMEKSFQNSRMRHIHRHDKDRYWVSEWRRHCWRKEASTYFFVYVSGLLIAIICISVTIREAVLSSFSRKKKINMKNETTHEGYF